MDWLRTADIATSPANLFAIYAVVLALYVFTKMASLFGRGAVAVASGLRQIKLPIYSAPMLGCALGILSFVGGASSLGWGWSNAVAGGTNVCLDFREFIATCKQSLKYDDPYMSACVMSEVKDMLSEMRKDQLAVNAANSNVVYLVPPGALIAGGISLIVVGLAVFIPCACCSYGCFTAYLKAFKTSLWFKTSL